ncbi:hypothetical protein AtEden1_Chr4g0287541 [Arabidopsis thaliana]
MSLAIKVFLLFLLVESSIALYRPDPNEKQKKYLDQSEIDYIRILRETVRGWQQEADKKYGIYSLSTSTNYMNRSLFLQDKVRGYVQLWGEWKNHKGYPYGDLRNKVHGNLWPMQYDYCRQYEGTNLLTYLMYGLSAEADIV